MCIRDSPDGALPAGELRRTQVSPLIPEMPQCGSSGHASSSTPVPAAGPDRCELDERRDSGGTPVRPPSLARPSDDVPVAELTNSVGDCADDVLTRTDWFVEGVDRNADRVREHAAAARMVPQLHPFPHAARRKGRKGKCDPEVLSPPMPIETPVSRHREKMQPLVMPLLSCVARPVGKKELSTNPLAQAAVKKEWDKLVTKGVWDMKSVREWSDVAAEARQAGRVVHHGSLAPIVVEKNHELPEGDPKHVFKGRVVFLGDQVHDQNWEAAMFQEIGSAPSTIEASRAADCYGLMPGNQITTSDGEQAYIQADLKGPCTWAVSYTHLTLPTIYSV